MAPFPELAAAAELAMLRVRLPAMVEQQGLVELLEGLTVHGTERRFSHISPRRLRISLRVSEALLARVRLQQTCLYRSLARYAVLRRAGKSVRFVMGMRRDERGEIEGHAWLEGDALGLDEVPVPAFTVVFAYPQV